jgi:serine/threonine protein kinase
MADKDNTAETIPLPDPQDETAATWMGPASLKVGARLLNRYEITGVLGQGGMGAVYRCHDTITGTDVALKAIPPELSRNTPEMADVRENFKLVEKLHHPNIAALKTLEQDPSSNDYYLIMECVEGVDLKQHARDNGGKLSVRQVVSILKQVASALDFAHAQKVIHRDIKPANIIVQPDGTAKLLDFGIAAEIATAMTRVTSVSQQISGTAPYMAPEQWKGGYQDAKTDQYALGVVAYSLLAGRLPLQSADRGVLREMALNDMPERPEGLDDSEWRSIAKALAKDKHDRHESCVAFAEALAREDEMTMVAGVAERRAKSKAPLLVVAAISILVICVGVWTATNKSRAISSNAAPPAPLTAKEEPQSGAKITEPSSTMSRTSAANDASKVPLPLKEKPLGDLTAAKTSSEAVPVEPEKPEKPAKPDSVKPDQPRPDPLTYEKPDSWTDQGASGMRAASFIAGPAEARVQVSAIRLGGGAEGLLPNVNRWRGQLGLDAIVQDELKLATIALASGAAWLVEMESPAIGDQVAQATLGAMFAQGGSNWEFKMTGPKNTVFAERDRFEHFMKSVRFAP